MKMEDPENLKERTIRFALRIIRLTGSMPKTAEGRIMAKQILRSGTSVGAQYREGKRAKSKADLISKIEGCLQELEETQYWLELLIRSKIIEANKLEPLHKETDELISIFVSIVRKLKGKSFHPS